MQSIRNWYSRFSWWAESGTCVSRAQIRRVPLIPQISPSSGPRAPPSLDKVLVEGDLALSNQRITGGSKGLDIYIIFSRVPDSLPIHSHLSCSLPKVASC